MKTMWNQDAARKLRSVAERFRPNVTHFHNTFPLLSPACYRAVRATGSAVVKTLQNYRLTCVNGLLYRDGGVCELCLGKRLPSHGIRYACYRHDHAASAVVASMLTVHHTLGTEAFAVVVTPLTKTDAGQTAMVAATTTTSFTYGVWHSGVGDLHGTYANFIAAVL
jgi:hypothetical protein